MNTGKSAAIGKLIVEGQHAVCWKGAWIGGRIKVGIHGAIVVHCGAEQIRAAWQCAGLLMVECLWMIKRGITRIRQMSVTVGPQSLHDGKEAPTL